MSLPTRRLRGGEYPLLDAGALSVAVIATLMVAPVWIWMRRGALDHHTYPRGFELLMLTGVALLTLLLSLLQVVVHIRAFGGAMVRGNRDDYPRASGLAARVVRAHANAVESLVPFAAIVLAAQTLGISNRGTVAGAALFLVARVVHAVSYSAGITSVRSAAFYAGVIGIVLVAAQLPWASFFPWAADIASCRQGVEGWRRLRALLRIHQMSEPTFAVGSESNDPGCLLALGPTEIAYPR